MPKYDFRCTSCGDITEVTMSAGSKNSEPCGSCGGALKRIFTPVGVVFKGSGFHNTDYKPRQSEKPEGGSCDSAGSKDSCQKCPASAS